MGFLRFMMRQMEKNSLRGNKELYRELCEKIDTDDGARKNCADELIGTLSPLFAVSVKELNNYPGFELEISLTINKDGSVTFFKSGNTLKPDELKNEKLSISEMMQDGGDAFMDMFKNLTDGIDPFAEADSVYPEPIGIGERESADKKRGKERSGNNKEHGGNGSDTVDNALTGDAETPGALETSPAAADILAAVKETMVHCPRVRICTHYESVVYSKAYKYTVDPPSFKKGKKTDKSGFAITLNQNVPTLKKKSFGFKELSEFAAKTAAENPGLIITLTDNRNGGQTRKYPDR